MMWRTVELTVNIIKELSITPSHWNVKRSYAEVAKKIGIDEETVRIRIQSLKQSGFLLGWWLILNANLLSKEYRKNYGECELQLTAPLLSDC